MIRNIATVQIPSCLGYIIALSTSTLWELSFCARVKVELQTEPELSRSEVVVLLKSPLCGYCCCSTSLHSFSSVILSQLESTHQDLSGDVKVVDRGQELVELHLSKVGLLFEFSQAYSPRPPKEIVALCHYSPARLTVTACSTSGWVPLSIVKLVWSPKSQKNIDHLLACFHLVFPSFFSFFSRLCDWLVPLVPSVFTSFQGIFCFTFWGNPVF